MEVDEMYCLGCWSIQKMIDGIWCEDKFYCKDCYNDIITRESEESKRKQEW